MIALDTNILVRFLLESAGPQHEIARTCITKAHAEGILLFVPQVVVCELLHRSEGFSAPDL